MTQPKQQRPDGSWGPAESLPWSDQIDWEVYGKGRERRAVAYWHATELARVDPGPWFGLRMRLASRRLARFAR
jgi:hypothetical protein